MPFISTPQGIEVKLLMTQNSVPLVNIFNVDAGHAVAPIDLVLAAGVIDAWITASYANLVHTSVTFDQIIATDISVPNGAQSISIPTTTAGLAGGAAASANASVVASLRTLHTGRNFRGRSYTVGMNAPVILDAQHTTVAHAAGVSTAYVNLLAAFVTAGQKLCVLSRYLNNVLRAVGLLTEIVTIITDTKIDSQRRRTAN
jgi:hypothetical protein